jgi:glutamine amidotransferase
MEQSRMDRAGLTHGHGWGVAEHPNGLPIVERQAWAAYHGEHFKKHAPRVSSHSVIAHVRRATVGPASLENTHPFVHGRWLFAHNGTVPRFEEVRVPMLEAMDPLHRDEIRGSTDSEHVFRYLMTLWGHAAEAPLIETLRRGLNQVIAWCREVDPDARASLNVLWTDGERMVGSRFGRTLWYLEREGIVACEICGKSHVHHDPKQVYRAVEVASEPITSERWLRVPNGTVFTVDPDMRLRIELLSAEAASAAAEDDGIEEAAS